MKAIAVAALTSTLLVLMPVSAPASTNVLRVTPGNDNFGAKPLGSVTFKSITVTNTSAETIDLVINVTREWDDFTFGSLPGSTCPVYEPAPLAPGESCALVVGFWPSETFLGLKQDQIFLATATDPITHELLDTAEFVFFGRAR
jgi:hypothetical protein